MNQLNYIKEEATVYHVVTERPMYEGQSIVFDDEHHNSVYHRVMTCKRILAGENVTGDLADFIRTDLDKWSKVTYRELSLEKVRKEEFPQYPSRMACLYTSQTLNEAKQWAKFFEEIGRNVFSIVKLKVNGSIFSGDACNCFDGVSEESVNDLKSRNYWRIARLYDNPVIETLVNGEILVDKIIEEYR
ncbi:DUF2441 domain-containing protein [Anaeromicropila herbilytica]|uniref:DUF2441 domain-containing protein n=1 Tax=Anaeromicropila herbilytica TaxID=2785025 RepID=A0A7R7ICS5_9FIRM|nr:DUF2441 domain-containing protein [Anaeromicropila herbilytica]BCN30832.1 hypothetical protein bsdtb5_21270 [Anaeromicropila herbilytica]